MVNKNEDGSLTVKIADFGLSSKIGKVLEFEAGTPGYLAPEIINHQKFPKNQKLTSKIDIYSLGCIFFEL